MGKKKDKKEEKLPPFARLGVSAFPPGPKQRKFDEAHPDWYKTEKPKELVEVEMDVRIHRTGPEW